MAMKDISIQINPDVFFWLRKSSGWTQEDVSHLLGISILKVKEWEKGHDAPRLNQLKKLARAYKRPLAAFLLPRPEIDQPLPSDFRLLPEANSKFTKDCLLKIRETEIMD
jgi:transcriptional regulator with XRE-family HTH domain